jgi:hypothetical protein
MKEDWKTLGKNLGCFVAWCKRYISFDFYLESNDDDDDNRRVAMRRPHHSLKGKKLLRHLGSHNSPKPQPKTRKIDSSTRSRTQSSKKDRTKILQKLGLSNGSREKSNEWKVPIIAR